MKEILVQQMESDCFKLMLLEKYWRVFELSLWNTTGNGLNFIVAKIKYNLMNRNQKVCICVQKI